MKIRIETSYDQHTDTITVYVFNADNLDEIAAEIRIIEGRDVLFIDVLKGDDLVDSSTAMNQAHFCAKIINQLVERSDADTAICMCVDDFEMTI